jgi:hypothetical protein
MSRHQVIRNGLGPLHIAEPGRAGWDALCGGTFGADVKTWRAGAQSTAVWGEWKHCGKCERRDRELTRR